MARYKPIDRNPRLLPVVLSEQIQPGSFEFALDHLVDHELDLSALDARFRNDETGASAYDTRVMLKIVLLAYSRGLISSRRIPACTTCNSSLSAVTANRATPTSPSSCASLETTFRPCSPRCCSRPDHRGRRQGKHKVKPDPQYEKKPTGQDRQQRVWLYRPEDFQVAEDASHCICPAGQKLHSNGSACTVNGRQCHKYTGSKTGCVPCGQGSQCLRHPQRTAVRQVATFAKGQPSANAVLESMKRRIDSPEGRRRYSQRIGTVEPVFGNIRHNKRLNRFTLRVSKKVGTQWRLYCLVHNIEKLAGCDLKK